LTLYQVKGVQR